MAEGLQGIERYDVWLSEFSCDLTYIRHWLNEFTTALQEPFAKRFDELIKQVEQ
jgi:hypothetical protein